MGGRGVSGAGCSPAKQSSHSGTRTHSLVVPAGWLSLLKARPANYSHRMQSWLHNGEPGDLTLLGPLTGLEVFTGKQDLLGSGCFSPSVLTVRHEQGRKKILSLFLFKPICLKWEIPFRAFVSLSSLHSHMAPG